MSMSWFRRVQAAAATACSSPSTIAIPRIGAMPAASCPWPPETFRAFTPKSERTGEDGLRVSDPGSTNGTFVNRERLDKHGCALLNDVRHPALRYLQSSGSNASPMPKDDTEQTTEHMHHTVMFDRSAVLP